MYILTYLRYNNSMRQYVFSITLVLSLLTSGCALSTGIRFGDDGSVSKPQVHGSVNVSGTHGY